MKNKHQCKLCNYDTDRLSSYKKHLLTKKHQRNKDKNVVNNQPKIGMIQPKIGKDIPKNGILFCKYCNKKISHKNHLKRHYNVCKDRIKHEASLKQKKEDAIKMAEEKIVWGTLLEKKILELEKEKEELRKRNEELNNKLIKYLEDDKNKIYNQTIINNIQNNIKIDINYIDKNCKDAIDYKEIMKIDLSKDEINTLENNSHIEGPLKIIYDRCIKNIPFNKRSIHLLDKARKKYYIHYDGFWEVDNNGEKFISVLISKVEPIYVSHDKNKSTKFILTSNDKFKNLFNSKIKVSHI